MKRFSQLVSPVHCVGGDDADSSDGPDCPVFLYQSRETRIVSFTFTLEHYAKFFTDPDFLIVLWRSLLDRI